MDDRFVVDFRNATIKNGENTILSNVQLQILPSEAVYLIGKTGTGKTSLLRSFYADLPITEGKALVNGVDLRKIQRREIPKLRRSIGMIFQSFQLFQNWTVAKNLSYVLQVTGWENVDDIKSRIVEVLKSVDLEQKAKAKIYELSGGEQQRVAIARALLNHPPLIIADEPTGNLDGESSNNIIKLLRELTAKSNTSLVIATHDMRMIEKFPSRVLICDSGRIIEQNR